MMSVSSRQDYFDIDFRLQNGKKVLFFKQGKPKLLHQHRPHKSQRRFWAELAFIDEMPPLVEDAESEFETLRHFEYAAAVSPSQASTNLTMFLEEDEDEVTDDDEDIAILPTKFEKSPNSSEEEEEESEEEPSLREVYVDGMASGDPLLQRMKFGFTKVSRSISSSSRFTMSSHKENTIKVKRTGIFKRRKSKVGPMLITGDSEDRVKTSHGNMNMTQLFSVPATGIKNAAISEQNDELLNKITIVNMLRKAKKIQNFTIYPNISAVTENDHSESKPKEKISFKDLLTKTFLSCCEKPSKTSE